MIEPVNEPMHAPKPQVWPFPHTIGHPEPTPAVPAAPEQVVRTSAVTDPKNKWIKIDENAPQGRKVQLINSHSRNAVYGSLPSDKYFTHYYPLPEFDVEDVT